MEKRYKPGEFAKLVNRTVGTLRKWDRDGKLVAQRMPSGHRYYTDEHLTEALNIERKQPETYNIIYARVSSAKQKTDLERQVSALETFCLGRGLIVGEIIFEVGGGLNYTRPKFLDLMQRIERREVNKLIVGYKDRLCRFGFDFFQHFIESHGGELIIANQQSMSPAEELTEDLLAVVHSFSCRLYGVRKYEKKIVDMISEKSGAKPDDMF
ncbi:MAG: IS607 family transposase [Cyanobacteria bacterium P01_D01_bin.50]